MTPIQPVPPPNGENRPASESGGAFVAAASQPGAAGHHRFPPSQPNQANNQIMKALLTENCILPPGNALTGQRNRLPPDLAQSTERAQPVRARTAFSCNIERGRAGAPVPNQTLVPSFLGNRRVLIVDDNVTNRKFLDRLCTAWGLRHRVADSAAAALSHLRRAAHAEAPFDLVILDHRVPDAGGLVLAKAIQADSTIPRPSLVMLTSRGARLPETQMEAHGLAACEPKPIQSEKLRVALGRVLAASR